jgi:K(+)-stimulated pyrophosphate-energized sodium pump
VIVPILVGIFQARGRSGGLLMGTIVSWSVCGHLRCVTGVVHRDNAKKYIEDGFHGGKGSEAHKAAVTG